MTSPGTACQRPCHTVAEDLAETQMRIFAESVCDSIMTFSKSLSFPVSPSWETRSMWKRGHHSRNLHPRPSAPPMRVPRSAHRLPRRVLFVLVAWSADVKCLSQSGTRPPPTSPSASTGPCSTRLLMKKRKVDLPTPPPGAFPRQDPLPGARGEHSAVSLGAAFVGEVI